MNTSDTSPTSFESLPANIMETIFRHMNVFQLKNARLVCTAWCNVVDGCRLLLDELGFTIRYRVLDRSFEPCCTLPVYSVKIYKSHIIIVNHWWPDLGATLSHLYLRYCHISLPTIAGILSQTPNLNNLGLKDIFLLNSLCSSNEIINDFRLEKLEHFSLCNIPDPLASLMRRVICPRLQSFGCAWESLLPQEDDQLIIDYFQDSQDSLKTTRLTPTAYILAGIGSLNRLQLHDVTFWCKLVEMEHVVCFTQKQNHIEKLSLLGIPLPELVVLQICTNLKGLKRLAVHLEYIPIWKPASLLAITPNLEYLEVMIMGFKKFATVANYRQYRTKTVGDFRDCRAPKLRDIRLTDIYPSCNFQSFLRLSQNLRTVLLDFACDDFTTLTSAIPIDQLHTLTLRSLTFLTPPSDLGSYENLRVLCLYHVRASKLTLTRLLAACPLLEEIVIFWIAGDNEVQQICKRFARLKELQLHQCPITDRSVDAVLAGCPALTKLTLHGCNRLSFAGRMRLRHTARFRLIEEC